MRLLVLFFLFLSFSCVDSDYDLSNVNTDDVGLSGDFLLPLGKVAWDIDSLLWDNKDSIPEDILTKPFPLQDSILVRFEVDMIDNMDQELVDKLFESGEVFMNTKVSNALPVDMNLSIMFEVFTPEEKSFVIVERELLRPAKQSGEPVVTILEPAKLSQEQLENIRYTEKIVLLLEPVHEGSEILFNEKILSESLEFTLSLKKTGGIPFN